MFNKKKLSTYISEKKNKFCPVINMIQHIYEEKSQTYFSYNQFICKIFKGFIYAVFDV